MKRKIYATIAALEKMTYAPDTGDFWNNPKTYDAENDTMTVSYDDDGNIYLAIDDADAEEGIFSEIEKFYAVELSYDDGRNSHTDYFSEDEKESALSCYRENVQGLAESGDGHAYVSIIAVYGYCVNGDILELGDAIDGADVPGTVSYNDAVAWLEELEAGDR